MDEEWELEEERELSNEEKQAIKFYDYDEGDWLEMSHAQQLNAIAITKRLTKLGQSKI